MTDMDKIILSILGVIIFSVTIYVAFTMGTETTVRTVLDYF